MMNCLFCKISQYMPLGDIWFCAINSPKPHNIQFAVIVPHRKSIKSSHLRCWNQRMFSRMIEKWQLMDCQNCYRFIFCRSTNRWVNWSFQLYCHHKHQKVKSDTWDSCAIAQLIIKIASSTWTSFCLFTDFIDFTMWLLFILIIFLDVWRLTIYLQTQSCLFTNLFDVAYGRGRWYGEFLLAQKHICCGTPEDVSK